ncbi:MAG: MFS transporter [Dehalococcoidia bacterium]|nr:MFS transporter [Dehalococcoidia bacterium]
MRVPHISHKWIVLAGGFSITVVAYAMRNTFSVFYPVIVDDFGWTRGGTALMFSIALLSYGLFAPIAGTLADRFRPRYVLAVGGVVVGGGLAFCSLASSAWHFYLIYGVLVAIGTSLIGITPLMSVLSHWFGSGRSGTVFGIIGSGFGVSLVTAPLFQWLISGHGWRAAYVIIGLCATAIIVPIGLLLMRRSPQQQALVDQKAAEAAGYRDSSPVQEQEHQWTAREALRTRTYQLFLIAGMCNMGFALQVVIGHQVYFLQDVGFDPMVAARVFSTFGIALATGNFSSMLSDRFGRVPLFLAGCLSATTAMFLLNVVGNPDSTVVPLLFALLAGWGLGVSGPTLYAAVADRFHGRNYGAIQGVMILFVSLGAAVGPWAGGWLHDLTGSYQSSFILVQALLLSAAVLFVAATRQSAGALQCRKGDGE